MVPKRRAAGDFVSGQVGALLGCRGRHADQAAVRAHLHRQQHQPPAARASTVCVWRRRRQNQGENCSSSSSTARGIRVDSWNLRVRSVRLVQARGACWRCMLLPRRWFLTGQQTSWAAAAVCGGPRWEGDCFPQQERPHLPLPRLLPRGYVVLLLCCCCAAVGHAQQAVGADPGSSSTSLRSGLLSRRRPGEEGHHQKGRGITCGWQLTCVLKVA